jgi:hypothetical protein
LENLKLRDWQLLPGPARVSDQQQRGLHADMNWHGSQRLILPFTRNSAPPAAMLRLHLSLSAVEYGHALRSSLHLVYMRPVSAGVKLSTQCGSWQRMSACRTTAEIATCCCLWTAAARHRMPVYGLSFLWRRSCRMHHYVMLPIALDLFASSST